MRILGWCVELVCNFALIIYFISIILIYNNVAIKIRPFIVMQVQAFFLVIDDIQDGSLYRRNQPCWYRHNGIGLAAINDGLMMENVIYYLIRKYFKGKEYYVDLLETFQNVSILVFCESENFRSSLKKKKKKTNKFFLDSLVYRSQNCV